MRYRYMRYPGGAFRAVTLSYDDGHKTDLKLLDIIDRYGIKCTFNLNSAFIGAEGRLDETEIRERILDKGHEVAVHGEYHRASAAVKPIEAMQDALNCRLQLESRFGRIIRGMAYPDSGIRNPQNGGSYAEVRKILESLEIAYSRSLGEDNNAFRLPTDFYNWIPTAHHKNKNLLHWVDEFLASDERTMYCAARFPRLFYLWGHSFEFERENSWSSLETFCKKIAGRSDVWYATNMEIYEYVHAYNSLIMSADSSRIYNPTLTEIWFDVDGVLYSVKPGETLLI